MNAATRGGQDGQDGQMRRPRSMAIAAIVAVAFGLMTLQSGGMVLFGPAEAQRAAGNVVPFVLWFNFLSGFGYVAAGVGLWRMKTWAFWLAAGIALALAIVLALLGLHAAGAGAFELRTLYALIFRLAVWSAIAAGACRVYACPGAALPRSAVLSDGRTLD